MIGLRRAWAWFNDPADIRIPKEYRALATSVVEPGPRTARKPGVFRSWTEALVVLVIALALVAIIGTAAMLVYLIASGRI